MSRRSCSSASTRARPASRPRCSTSACGRSREARRDKVNRHPAAGLGREGRARDPRRRRRGRRRAARRRARRGRRLRPRPRGRVGARLGRRDRRAADARSSSGRTSARRRSSTELSRRRGRDPAAQRAAARPLLLGRQARLAAASTTTRSTQARDARHAADGHRRRVPLRPPRRRLRHRRRRPPRARSCSGSARPAGTRGCCELFGVPLDVLPEVRDTVGELGDAAPRALAGRAAAARPGRSTSRRRSPAPAASCPGRVKATYGTGVFVLAHVGDEVPKPAGGLLPTVAWRIDGRDRVRARRRRVRRRGDARVAVRELGIAADPAALGALAREARTGRRPRAPGLAGLGAPWWRPNARAVLAGIDGGTTGAHVARAALEGIAWRVADIVAAIRETVPVDTPARRRRPHQRAAAAGAPGRAIGAPVEARAPTRRCSAPPRSRRSARA